MLSQPQFRTIKIDHREYMKLLNSGTLNQFLANAGFDLARKYTTTDSLFHTYVVVSQEVVEKPELPKPSLPELQPYQQEILNAIGYQKPFSVGMGETDNRLTANEIKALSEAFDNYLLNIDESRQEALRSSMESLRRLNETKPPIATPPAEPPVEVPKFGLFENVPLTADN